MKRIIILLCVFALICVGMVSASSTDNIIAYYNFSFNADDSSGNGLDGTLTAGANITTGGIIGNASGYDGTDDLISIADTDLLTFGNGTDDFPFSISAWIYPIKDSSDPQIIFSKYGNPYEYYLRLNNAEQLSFVMRDDEIGVNPTITADAQIISLDTWTHVVMTYDGTGGATAGNGVLLYINGSIATSILISNQATYVAMNNTNSVITIGMRDDSTTFPFKGSIDETGVFNYTLSATEVNRLYTINLLGYTPTEINISEPSTYYVNQSGGNDSNGGLTSSTALKTITKVNTLSLGEGDTVLFSCDSTFRSVEDAYLDIKSGTSAGHVTYGSYGDCSGWNGTGYSVGGSLSRKPLFLGSYNASSTANWTDMGSNIWEFNKTLDYDFGSMIFNGDSSWCDKKNTDGGLVEQGDCTYNFGTDNTMLYSVGNPATYYNNIEISYSPAFSNPEGIIDYTSSSYVILENLEVKYARLIGFNGANSNHIILRNNTVRYSGGGYTSTAGTTRFGGGIQFGLTTKNISIDNNIVLYSWDACITVQSWNTGSGKTMKNINVTNNICGYSPELFEWFQSIVDAGTNTKNILIEHNTVFDGTNQEEGVWCPTRGGRDLRLARTPAETDNYIVRNNIFFNNSRQFVDLGSSQNYNWLGDIQMNYNLYFGLLPSTPFSFNGTDYNTLTTFKSGTVQETNGIESNPLFLSTIYGDSDFLVPAAESPACLMSSTGSYVGALPCATDISPPAFTGIKTNASSNTYYNGDVQINITAQSELNISAYTLTILNNSDSTLYNLTIVHLDGTSNASIVWNWTINGFTEIGGTQYYKFWANTTDGTNDYSSLFDFTVQNNLVPPSFSLNATNVTSTTFNGSTVQINLTIEDDFNISFYVLMTTDTPTGVYANKTLQNNAGVGNVSMIWNYTIGNFSINGGDFSWRVWANDTNGNVNISQIYTLVVNNQDTTPPTVNITYPTNGSNISSNSIDLNATATDNFNTSDMTYYWVINGTTNATTIDANTTFNASDGYYNLTLFVWDGVQNGSDTVLFTLDTTPPSINFTLPTDLNNSVLTRNYLLANVSATDNTAIDFIVITLYDSNFVQLNRTTSQTSHFFVNFTNLQFGNYYLNATVNDTSNNVNSTGTRLINISCWTPRENWITNATRDPFCDTEEYSYNSTIASYNLSHYSFYNITINETTTDYHLIQLRNNGTIKLPYNGRKDFKVENNTITINNMPTSFNQIFNSTSTTKTAENVNTFTESIPPNNRSFVFSYLTAFQPKFSEIGLGITDITPNYDSTQKNFSFDCTGTGDIKVTNLNDLDGKYGYVEVRHNGTFKEYVEPDYYTVSVCSNWQFLTTDYGFVASDGGVSDSSSSGGCWGLARAEDTCYYISEYGECFIGCPTDSTCNSSYDFNSLNGETLDYCISDETVTTPPPTPKDTIEKIKDKLKEADTRIEQGIEKVLGISKPPRGQLEMFLVYSYLRFKENVINKIFFGSWILFSVLAFVITISSIEITTKIKKKKKRKF